MLMGGGFWQMLRHMPALEVEAMEATRHVRLFRNGRHQALRIPREFEFQGEEAIIHKEGDRLIIEPVRPKGLLRTLATLQPLDEDFPDIDEGLLPAEVGELLG